MIARRSLAVFRKQKTRDVQTAGRRVIFQCLNQPQITVRVNNRVDAVDLYGMFGIRVFAVETEFADNFIDRVKRGRDDAGRRPGSEISKTRLNKRSKTARQAVGFKPLFAAV